MSGSARPPAIRISAMIMSRNNAYPYPIMCAFMIPLARLCGHNHRDALAILECDIIIENRVPFVVVKKR
jgi:hypothetical protein